MLLLAGLQFPLNEERNAVWGSKFKWVEFGLAFDLGSSMDNEQGRTGAHKIDFLCKRRKIKLFFSFLNGCSSLRVYGTQVMATWQRLLV